MQNKKEEDDDSSPRYKPKFTLGKMKSKYLMIEMLSYSGYNYSAIPLLYSSSKNLRQLYNENKMIIFRILPVNDNCEICYLEHFRENDHLCLKCGLVHFGGVENCIACEECDRFHHFDSPCLACPTCKKRHIEA